MSTITNDMNRYFLIISTSIGIPCNLVSILIFSRLMKQKTNMGFLYTIQCLVDLSLILITLFLVRSTSVNLYPITLDSLSDPLCKFIKFIRRYPLHLSSWMPVLITFDRFIYIFYGNTDKFKFMKKKLNLAAIILVMFLILAILNLPNCFFYLPDRVAYSNGTLGPVTVCTASLPILISSDMISIFFRTYIPLALMLILNTLMIRKIFNKSRAAFNQTSLSRKEYLFTFYAMAYDVYFFVLNFPLSVYYVIYDLNFYMGTLTGDFGALLSFLNALFLNVSLCIQTLSFFMNLAFNKLFRQTFLHMTGHFYGLSTSRVKPTSHKSANNSVSAKNTT